MWKNEKQQITAIRCLLRTLFPERRVRAWWADDGPTKEAVRLLKAKGGELSHGEAIMFRAAFDFWGGHGDVRLEEILAVLDHQRARALCGLLLAVCIDNGYNNTINEWIKKQSVVLAAASTG
jgi:hypothetical protein